MLTELIREERLHTVLRFFDKEYKSFRTTRIIYLIAFVMIGLMASMIAAKSPWFYLTVPAAGIIGWKLPYYNLLALKSKYDKINAHLFASFLTSFMALVPSTGNVYQTLVACVPYTKEPLQGKLLLLIEDIEKGNSRDGYLAFAEYVGSGESFMLMDMIYQFSEFGMKKDTLKELFEHVQDLQKNRIDEVIESKMRSMDMLGFMPMGIAMFMVMCFAGVLIAHYIFTDVMQAVGGL